MEIVGTFFFVAVICNLKRINGSKHDGVNAFAIGLTLYGILNMVGSSTGGCFNPAVALAQTVYQHLMN